MSLTPISYRKYSVGDLLTWSWVLDNPGDGHISEDKKILLVIEDRGFDELVVQFTSGKILEINSVLREHLTLLSRLS
tara:strand:+ start:111 stop:341 length:231 start_codon:yes stop_codon:yes gene_type:complete